MHDWDINWFRIPVGALQWKSEAPSPKWESLSKLRFWTAMGHTFPEHGASMHIDCLRALLASPLTKVKSTKFGNADVLNIQAGAKMVKMLCTPHKGPQDPLKSLEALETSMIILNANLADGADSVSPRVLEKLSDNFETVLVINCESLPMFDVLEAPCIAEKNYWYQKVQVCHWLPGARQDRKRRISSETTCSGGRLKIEKKVCTLLSDCEASHSFDISLLLITDPTMHRLGSPRT